MNVFDFVSPFDIVLGILLSIFELLKEKIQNEPVQGEIRGERLRKNKLKRIAIIVFVFSIFVILVDPSEEIGEMLRVENAILPENSNWFENENFYIKTGSPFIKAYFTVGTDNINQDGILYENKLELNDPIFTSENGEIRIFYRLTFLGFNYEFLSSDVNEKVYKIGQNSSGEIPNEISLISIHVVDNYPCISESEVNSERNTLCVYKELSINGIPIGKRDVMNAIVRSGNLSSVVLPSLNNTIEFSNSNQHSFQKIYIMGGKNIDKIFITTKNQNYICEFPELVGESAIVEIDFGNDIFEETLQLSVISNSGKNPEMVSLWFDKYIVV